MNKSPNYLEIEADSSDYDFENDSLFVIRKGVQLETSIDLGNVILDIGVDDTPVGFEILHASKMFKISKHQIKSFHRIIAEYIITEKTIEVKFTITVNVRNYKTPKVAISQGVNDMDLPPAQISMVC
jgi:uncharacterized protein YuzE